jgi:hypothetical protein
MRQMFVELDRGTAARQHFASRFFRSIGGLRTHMSLTHRRSSES